MRVHVAREVIRVECEQREYRDGARHPESKDSRTAERGDMGAYVFACRVMGPRAVAGVRGHFMQSTGRCGEESYNYRYTRNVDRYQACVPPQSVGCEVSHASTAEKKYARYWRIFWRDRICYCVHNDLEIHAVKRSGSDAMSKQVLGGESHVEARRSRLSTSNLGGLLS